MPKITMVSDNGTSTDIEVPADMFQFLRSRLSVIPRQETQEGNSTQVGIYLSYGHRTRINAILTDVSRAVASENFPRFVPGQTSLVSLISLMRDNKNRYMRLEGENASLLSTPQSSRK